MSSRMISLSNDTIQDLNNSSIQMHFVKINEISGDKSRKANMGIVFGPDYQHGVEATLGIF